MEIGPKIRRLRKLRGLTIEELAVGAELTKGFISQVERDKTVPNVLNLKQIVEFLGLDLATFFSDFEEVEHNIFTRKERVDEKKGPGYHLTGLIPRLKYLEMEPVLLTIAPNATYDRPFEDDEGFGYLLKGSVELTVDEEKRSVSKGACFYIFFDKRLVIKNLTNKPAEILLVNY